MATKLNFGRDIQGMNAYAPATADNKFSVNLATLTETNVLVPNDVQNWIAVFSYQPGTSVWVDLTGNTAAVPVGSTLQPTTSEQNPGSRTVLAGTKISMISGNANATVGVSLYAVSYT